jgi:hypothetical protein
MIEGIGCSTQMTQALLELPALTFSRIEAALRQAFRAPEAVQQYANVPGDRVELHVIVSEDVLFLLGDNRSRIELLRVMLFEPDPAGRTVH